MSQNKTITPNFRKLAIATSFFIYLLMVVGGIVRVTESGLGCPDWPTCYGGVVPPAEITAIIESTHRYVAGIGGILILATAFFSFKDYRKEKWIVIPALTILPLLTIQIGLGAFVVLTELEPLLVATHLALAMTIFACTLIVSVYVTRPEGELVKGTTAQRNRMYVSLGLLFTLLILGSIVVGTDALHACQGWPLCSGALWPPSNAAPIVWIHLLHRYSAGLFAGMITWYIYKNMTEQKDIPVFNLWAWIFFALLLSQITIGAAQVWLHKPAWLRGLHLATASAVWGAMVILTLLNHLGTDKQES